METLYKIDKWYHKDNAYYIFAKNKAEAKKKFKKFYENYNEVYGDMGEFNEPVAVYDIDEVKVKKGK